MAQKKSGPQEAVAPVDRSACVPIANWSPGLLLRCSSGRSSVVLSLLLHRLGSLALVGFAAAATTIAVIATATAIAMIATAAAATIIRAAAMVEQATKQTAAATAVTAAAAEEAG